MKNFLAIFMLGISSSIVLAKEISRPMKEMHGDCGSYKLNLSNELELWKGQAVPQDQNKEKSISPGSLVILDLKNEAQVKFISKPEKTFSFQSPRFGGLFHFKPLVSGKYRVSAGEKLWFDLIRSKTNKIVKADAFEMQTQCSLIFKTVEFHLEKGVDYFIQISSSQSEKVKLLVTKTE